MFAFVFAFVALWLADATNNLDLWSAVVGFFMPLVLAIPVQEHWSDQIRAIFTFAACVVAALVTTLLQQGGFDWQDWIHSSLVVLVLAITTYKGLWTKVAPQVHNKGNLNAT